MHCRPWRAGALRSRHFFILTALVGEPRHGYGIVGEVEDLSEGRVHLQVGTLYGVLDRLVGEGWSSWTARSIKDGCVVTTG